MGSTLIITPVEELQEKINEMVSSFRDTTAIYVSLNKTQKSVEKALLKANVKTDKVFFIDCATNERTTDDVLHINPRNLDELAYSIKTFVKSIQGRKSLLIDALSTLLIYNSENKVAAFIKEIAEYSIHNDVEIVALSPQTKGEELLNKIFNFFDLVVK